MQFIFLLGLFFNPLVAHSAQTAPDVLNCTPDTECSKFISSYTYLSYLTLKNTEIDVQTMSDNSTPQLAASTKTLSAVETTNVLLSSMTNAIDRFVNSGGAMEIFMQTDNGLFMWGFVFGLCLIAGLRS